MNKKLILLFTGLFLLSSAVFAHRLNEYLQASTIEIAKDHLVLKIHLTAGEDVARKVLAGIDTNGDGIIIDAEQKDYSDIVSHDLLLTIDGKITSLRVDSFSFPVVGAINEGLGDILITFEAGIPSNNSNHRLTFENHHQRSVAVYLVNCLLPKDPNTNIVNQSRNYNQSFYQLDFTVSGQSQKLQATNAVSEQQQLLKTAENESVMKTFFFQGIYHILSGYDHLLFLIALVLAAASFWELIKVITAFTLAHSITLTLAVCNLVHLPQQLVELFVSASIVFVALQNIFRQQSAQGRSRLAIAFFFGLFHGLGFAGVLLHVMHQMPKETVLLAILGFTVGIEAGNQIVLLPLFGLLKAVRFSQKNVILQKRLSAGLQRVGSVAVAMAGMYYLYVALTANF